MAVVDELITLLGLEVDPKAETEARGFQESIAAVKNTALVAGTALLALAGATAATSKGFAAATDQSKKFADSLDFDFSSLQELEFATKRSGGSIEGLRADLVTLNNTYGDGEAAIARLAARFDGLSNRRAQQLGDSLGLSQDTILLLQQGSVGIAKLRAEARQLGGIIPDDLAKQTAAFNDELTNLEAITSGINNRLQAALIPSFTEATQSLRVFLVENEELIGSGLEEFIDGVQLGFSQFGDIVDAVSSTVLGFLGPLDGMVGGLEFAGIIGNTVTGILVALAVVLTPIAIKFIAIAAAIAAVIVIVDDLITYIQGGESAIGSFLDAFEQRFPALFDLVSSAAGVFGDFFAMVIDGWRMIGEGVANLLPSISDLAEGIGEALESFAEFLGFGSPELKEEKPEPKKPEENDPPLEPEQRRQAIVEPRVEPEQRRQAIVEPRVEPEQRRQAIVEALAVTVRTLEVDSESAPTSAPVPASVINSSSVQRGGDVNQTFHIDGSQDPRLTASEVARKSSFGSMAQTLTPGPRAPRTA